MLIKRLDGKKESAEESSEEYKNAIEGNENSEKRFAFFVSSFMNLSINKAN